MRCAPRSVDYQPFMPVLDSTQRKNLTLKERQRLAVLVSNFVRGIITEDGDRELKKLMKKAGPKDLALRGW